MLEIDERAGNEKRNEQPIGQGHLPREHFPDAEEEKGRQEFDREVAEGDRAAAVGAAAA